METPAPTTTDQELPGRIDLRSERSRWLTRQLQFGDEPLTRTVERALESAYAAKQVSEKHAQPT